MALAMLGDFDSTHSVPVITADWQEWIETNLQRGCEIDGMVVAMVGRGFKPEQARQAIMRKAGYTYQNFSWMDKPTIKTHDREILISTFISEPKILVLDNVLSLEECQEIIERSRPKLRSSTTVDNKSGAAVAHPDRTSESAYLPDNSDPFMAGLNHRFAEIMHLPLTHGEEVQVVRYQPGGQYKPHFDYFPPSETGSQVQMRKGGQRCATLLMYLNDVEEGGTTGFPHLKLKVVPKPGRAVFFHYVSEHGQVDPKTQHSGDPVIKGEKWIATKWMRVSPRK